MRVWITKYALTTGVIETDAEICEKINVDMIDARDHGVFHKPDWHDNEPDATRRVHEMIVAKIKSTEKQLGKLEQQEYNLRVSGLKTFTRKESVIQ